MLTHLLGGITPQQFLAEYWQKKPLHVRQAVPGFTGVASRAEIFDLACDGDVESRLVRYRADAPETSTVDFGPQRRTHLRGKKAPWTVLVQGLNLWVPAGEALLHQFDFIPQARLDDLMVSYAVDGGGVGPHFDNYDVFLLQGFGRRRWQLSNQDDRSVYEDAPLRILKDFQPVHDWVMEPGDLLYLPPQWAHNGIAIGECTTYSIGFKSPTAQELAAGFLDWLGQNLALEGMYADPDLVWQENSAEIGPAMIDQVARMLSGIRWERKDIAAFLGSYLTEPKPTVFFDPPETPVDDEDFSRALAAHGAVLDPRSLLLWSKTAGFHLNGEVLSIDAADHATLQNIAHQRGVSGGAKLSPAIIQLLYGWYEDGFLHLEENAT